MTATGRFWAMSRAQPSPVSGLTWGSAGSGLHRRHHGNGGWDSGGSGSSGGLEEQAVRPTVRARASRAVRDFLYSMGHSPPHLFWVFLSSIIGAFPPLRKGKPSLLNVLTLSAQQHAAGHSSRPQAGGDLVRVSNRGGDQTADPLVGHAGHPEPRWTGA